MRKLTHAKAVVALLAGFAFALPNLYAQTTFATSNNTQANITIDQMDDDATVVTISQHRGGSSYVELSQHTVVKDQRTGIASKLIMLDCNIDPLTDVETHHLTFTPFLDEIESFDLINPVNQNASLFFSRVKLVASTDAIVMSAQE